MAIPPSPHLGASLKALLPQGHGQAEREAVRGVFPELVARVSTREFSLLRL